MDKDGIDTDYDNCLGEKHELPSLSKFLGEEIDDIPDKEWKKHWVGMPEFIQEDNPPYKKLIMSFRNKEDYDAFAKLIDQKLTEKTKSAWYPGLDRDANSLRRWISEE